MTDAPDRPAVAQPDQQLAALRQILLGKDYRELLALRQQLLDPGQHAELVAGVVSEALAMRGEKDSSLSETLAPTVEQALVQSIQRDPKQLANALYPVMGPAIRKSIHEVLNQTLETFNQLLEQSLSPRSLGWRLDAWRTGRSYPEVVLMKTLLYQVEQVFLIHRESGLLLQHVVSPMATTKDPDMVSGMLTAIQDFVRDSFAVDDDESLNTMRLGDLAVMVEQGPYAVVAAVVRGNPPASVRGLLNEAQESVHLQFGRYLQHYEGDNAPLEPARPLLERCLATQQQESKRSKPWLALAVLAAFLAGLGYWAYQKHLDNQGWKMALGRLQAEPGLVVVDAEKTSSAYRLEGLRDPLARDPATVLAGQLDSGRGLSLAFKPYLSMEPEMVLQRARHMLQPPAGVVFGLDANHVLQVSGSAHLDWQHKLDAAWPLVAGVSALDAAQLLVQDPEGERLQAEQAQLDRLSKQLVARIQSGRFEFAVGSSALEGGGPHAAQMAGDIRELLATVRRGGKMLQVTLLGQADATGDGATNARLRQERAENMRQYLIQQGVPAAVLFANGSTAPDSQVRGVTYLVDVY